jgi:hypothetical protein
MPTWSKELQLQPGINVMDLTPWYTEEEIQMLVIRSCMEHILKEENNVIVCLPEAWKLLPEQRNTPVKLYFEKYIREGATNGNYLNLDAQDLGGLSKAPLRQVSVWIMGRMQESNEVERLLKQMLGVDIASRAIQTLPLGHFMVAAGDKVVKVYVLPKGVPPEMGIAVAKGEKTAEEVKQWLINLNSLEASVATGKESPAIPEEIKEITPVETTPVEEPIVTFNTDELSKDKGTGSPEETADKPGYGSDPRDTIRKSLGIDKLEERLAKVEASLLLEKMGTTTAQLYQTKRIVKVTPAEKTVNLNTDNHAGKVMWLAKKGFLKSWHSLAEVEKELSEYGWNIPRVNLGNTLKDLVEKGYVGTRKTDRTQYRLAEFVEIQ